MILEEEDQLIDSHKRHIDAIMELAKKEMALLQEISKPGSDVSQYVKGLDAILEHKLEIISILKSRLLGFCYHLKQEEELSSKFYCQQKEISGEAKAETCSPGTDQPVEQINSENCNGHA